MTRQELLKLNMDEALMLIGDGNDNKTRIMRAGAMAGAFSEDEISDYIWFGRMPDVHTFDEWNNRGRAVRKGEHKAFDAVIWVPKTQTAEVETEEGATEEERFTNFYQHKAYFFRKDQTDEITFPHVDLPEDVFREVRRGVEYLTGNTRPIKDALKEANYKWSRKKSAWYRPAQG